ncbi:hypothetical protein MKS88_003373 [Plasmodium brasilianum]|uniref:Uncharacterized protein n=1 Tax=Plasmodium brasilianum TaxID=5824 RepID=A0ACB9Y8Q6_PLABR|nr:hypothetical protein MKS88_003373 [Plasmodium brasilianum]
MLMCSTPGKGLHKAAELHTLLKSELTYEFIKIFESLKSLLVHMKECVERMKALQRCIKECKDKNATTTTATTASTTLLHSLDVFFNNTMTYFSQDYKLKEKIHETLVHVDGTCEDELNRIKLMWKESPFLFLIFQKYNVNKLIMEYTQI